MNHRAKFDAASFIFVGEICNRTNTQTHEQAVNDISTLCLSARVDNKLKRVFVMTLVYCRRPSSLTSYTCTVLSQTAGLKL